MATRQCVICERGTDQPAVCLVCQQIHTLMHAPVPSPRPRWKTGLVYLLGLAVCTAIGVVCIRAFDHWAIGAAVAFVLNFAIAYLMLCHIRVRGHA